MDTLTGTTVRGAYGLRKLRGAYSGPAIRVRRSSDNAEVNIGFDGSGNLDTAALASHVGAGQGFVVTWHDQSGNGQDMTQATAANQPEITASSGALHTLPGGSASRAAARLVGANGTRMACASFGLGGTANTLGLAMVLSPSVLGGADVLQYTPDMDTLWYSGTGTWDFTTTGNNGTSYLKREGAGYAEAQYNWLLSAGAAFAVQAIANGTDLRTWGNGTEGAVNAAATATFLASGALCLGGRTETPLDGHVAEVIVASVMAGTDRAAIETDQRTYFGF